MLPPTPTQNYSVLKGLERKISLLHLLQFLSDLKSKIFSQTLVSDNQNNQTQIWYDEFN